VTLDETRALLAYAAGIDPRVRRNDPDERAMQAAAWHQALARLPVADAKAALDRHYRDSREAALPADVRRRAAVIRDARVDAAGPLQPPGSLSDAEQARWLREARQAIADGAPAPAALGGKPAAPAGGLGFGVPAAAREELGRDEGRSAALGVACPWCRAEAGRGCVNALGRPLGGAHQARRAAAGEDVAVHEPEAPRVRPAPPDTPLPGDPPGIVLPARKGEGS
jgi:hypothetical protein